MWLNILQSAFYQSTIGILIGTLMNASLSGPRLLLIKVTGQNFKFTSNFTNPSCLIILPYFQFYFYMNLIIKKSDYLFLTLWKILAANPSVCHGYVRLYEYFLTHKVKWDSTKIFLCDEFGAKKNFFNFLDRALFMTRSEFDREV